MAGAISAAREMAIEVGVRLFFCALCHTHFSVTPAVKRRQAVSAVFPGRKPRRANHVIC